MDNNLPEIMKLDMNEIHLNDFIRKLDVKDKSALIMITTKMEAGMLLMSSTYGRYFQSILPFMVVAREKFKEDEKMAKICRKKFSSMTRTYIRTDKEASKEQPAVYALKGDNYDLILSKKVKQLETHVVISLSDIDDGLQSIMNRIHSLYMYPIDQCETSIEFEETVKDVTNLTYKINAVFEDVSKVFLDADSDDCIDKMIEENTRILEGYYLITSNPLRRLYNFIKGELKYLTILYHLVSKISNEICMSVDLSAPINMEDDNKSFEDLYSDFCEMNDKVVKNDPRITGFDPVPKKKKKPFFNFLDSWGTNVIADEMEEPEYYDEE